MSTYWRPSIPGSLLATFTTRRTNNNRNMNCSSTVDANKSPSAEVAEDTNGGGQQREDIILTPASTTMSEGSEGERNERREAEGESTRRTDDNAEMGELKMENNNNNNDHHENIPEEEDWTQYTPSRNNREIHQEMGSLNNEIPNLKGLFARSSSAMDEEADVNTPSFLSSSPPFLTIHPVLFLEHITFNLFLPDVTNKSEKILRQRFLAPHESKSKSPVVARFASRISPCRDCKPYRVSPE